MVEAWPGAGTDGPYVGTGTLPVVGVYAGACTPAYGLAYTVGAWAGPVAVLLGVGRAYGVGYASGPAAGGVPGAAAVWLGIGP